MRSVVMTNVFMTTAVVTNTVAPYLWRIAVMFVYGIELTKEGSSWCQDEAG